MIPAARPVSVAVAVVLDGGRVLVGRRASDAADAAGRAEFPGGRVEAAESPAAAAARECLEETGIAVRVGSEIGIAATGSSRGPIEIRFFRAEPIGPTDDPRSPFVWVPITAIAGLSFPDANAAVVARLLAGEGHAPLPDRR